MNVQIKQRIEQIISNIASLPAIPEVASKVINMVNDPDISIKKVGEEISKDQSMTTNLLKLCNSAYFSKGKEITSVERAIVTLGLKEVKDIVMVIATKPVLNKFVIGYDLGKGDLWKQGLVVSATAKKIALLKKRKDVADVVFTGGIIHNVGKVVLALFVQSTFKEILDAVTTKSIPFTTAEREIMGFSHQEVGEAILNNWKFPEVLRTIVRYYQEPELAPDQYKFEVAAVHIADALSIMAGIGIGSDGLYHQLNEEAIKTVGLKEAEIEDLFAKIPETLKQVRDLI
ncbi:MAG: HDOD domain-containing protein [bacterium]|nr:HDOD domain-containing protein [bacterium]